jgi:hypothetical protein
VTNNNQIYYNPNEKKLLHSITGTHSLGDWVTDLKLATGIGFKESKRYKDSHSKLRDAKQKYGIDNATVVGHSLGGQIANYVGGRNDRVVTLDKAATIGSSLKRGEHYRTSGDIVSALDVNKKHIKTINNGGSLASTLAKGVSALYTGNVGLGLATAKDILNNHNVDKIKDQNITV